jgi:riboflavin kinase/FMN adenylyltransferase
MRVERYQGEALAPSGAVTVGTFDGVHRGHRAVLDSVIAASAQTSLPSTVVTFDPHPRAVVQGETVPLLTTIEERADALSALGIDRLVVLPFDRKVAQWSAERFVRRVLVEGLQARTVVVGHDHGFGRARSGDAGQLERLGEAHGFSVVQVEPHVEGDLVVSSTKIRRAVEEGRMADAAQLLGRPYRMIGPVVQGDQRGRTIGFPTANLTPQPGKVLPLLGVYAADVRLAAGAAHRAAVNVGVRPTFGGQAPGVEVHVLDFDGDLYGQTLAVDFLQRLREERRFSGPDTLRAQLAADVDRCRTL